MQETKLHLTWALACRHLCSAWWWRSSAVGHQLLVPRLLLQPRWFSISKRIRSPRSWGGRAWDPQTASSSQQQSWPHRYDLATDDTSDQGLQSRHHRPDQPPGEGRQNDTATGAGRLPHPADWPVQGDSASPSRQGWRAGDGHRTSRPSSKFFGGHPKGQGAAQSRRVPQARQQANVDAARPDPWSNTAGKANRG